MKSIWKFIVKWFLPSRNGWKMLGIMIPFMIIGWALFPAAPITYYQWIIGSILIMIWFDIMEIKNRLNIK
jgi:hypothetical protein